MHDDSVADTPERASERPFEDRSFVNDRLKEIRQAIQVGEAPQHVLELIAKAAADIPQIRGVTIIATSNDNDEEVERKTITSFGEVLNFQQGAASATETVRTANMPLVFASDLVFQGKSLGLLIAFYKGELPHIVKTFLKHLSEHAATVLGIDALQKQLLAAKDTLEVAHELNAINASAIKVSRSAKALVRGAAFRFGADVCCLMLNALDKETLDIVGVHGCEEADVPTTMPPERSVLGKVLRLGGRMSITDLAGRADDALGFLLPFEISCVHCVSVENKGCTFGAMVLGFKHVRQFTTNESKMLEEYAKGSGVALAHAVSQERLTNYTEQLEGLVKERTEDLEREKKRAEEANRAKSGFVANMSHELRTPLTAIVAYSSVLQSGVFGDINIKQREALESVSRSADHLKELIDDVLDISKAEAGKFAPEPQKVNIEEAIRYAIKLLYQAALAKSITLHEPEIASELKGVELFVDIRHIRQALINLLSNAIKYTPRFGQVRISAQALADQVKIIVQDTGVGISAEQMTHLFQRFQRGTDDYSKEQQGTGIGLALTKHLIEINGGSIGAESKEGAGSTFWLVVPAVNSPKLIQQQTKEQTTAQQPLPRLEGLNILVVDDNQTTCDTLKMILGEMGANVHTTTSVHEAITIIESMSFDVALVDLVMQGETGFQLIEYIRGHPNSFTKELPIIVVTACVFAADKERAKQSGTSAFIAKPFDPAHLIQELRKVATTSAVKGRG